MCNGPNVAEITHNSVIHTLNGQRIEEVDPDVYDNSDEEDDSDC